MAHKRPFNITLAPEMIAQLREIERQTGIRPAELIRRAIAAELARRAEPVKNPND